MKSWGEECVKTIQKYKDDFQNFLLLLNEIDSRGVANMRNDSNISKLFRALYNIFHTDFVYDVASDIVRKKSSHSKLTDLWNAPFLNHC